MSMRAVQTVTILNAATATGAGESHAPWNPARGFQIIAATTSGAGSAVVKIQVSNDKTNWIDLATFTETLSSTAVTEGFISDSPWRYVRANVSSISGTGAYATVIMSSEGE